MKRIHRRSMLLALAAAAILAAVLVAVLASGGSGHGGRSHGAAGGGATSGEIAQVAKYLGISPQRLREQLNKGLTLTQIADSRTGKSATGLAHALLSAGTARIEREASAKHLSPAAQRARLRRLRRRVARQLTHQRRQPAALATSAAYLGVGAAQLRAELKAGRSLAQIADATTGKSATGLVDALVRAREATLESALASGLIGAHTERQQLAAVRRRITAEVQRKPPHGG
jgi:uncharacterized protein YwbE